MAHGSGLGLGCARTLLLALLPLAVQGCMIIETHPRTSSPGEASCGAGETCRYLIDGVVVDAESGLPIASAQVRVGDDYAYTDREGMFALTVDTVPGCHALTASHMDYAPDSIDVVLDSSDVTVGAVGLWSAR